MLLHILIAAVVCYFLGNHNGAICVSLMWGDDVRSHGSGNAGLTNFVRSYGTHRALLVILIDAGKAVLACILSGLLFAPYDLELQGRVWGGMFVLLGHVYPALQGLRGGKGILSGWFVAWCVDWRIALAIGVVFFAAYYLTRYVSLGSMLGVVAFGVGFIILYHDDLWVWLGGVLMSFLCLFAHRSNIVRLLKGQEKKTDLFSRGKRI
jgi:glycerol-3-phosphate acyltransferase PlsY